MDSDNQLNISVLLRIERTADAAVIAQLGIRNGGRQAIRLWKLLTMPDGELDADRFIINTDGGMAKYLGRTVKRPAPTADDFLLIQPEQVVVSTVRLDRYYALPEHGQITVVYQAFNPSVGGQPMIKLRSNEANISLP